jgi:hypothetical protein
MLYRPTQSSLDYLHQKERTMKLASIAFFTIIICYHDLATTTTTVVVLLTVWMLLSLLLWKITLVL